VGALQTAPGQHGRGPRPCAWETKLCSNPPLLPRASASLRAVAPSPAAVRARARGARRLGPLGSPAKRTRPRRMRRGNLPVSTSETRLAVSPIGTQKQQIGRRRQAAPRIPYYRVPTTASPKEAILVVAATLAGIPSVLPALAAASQHRSTVMWG
jgi:hypothetical protein